MRRSRNGQDPGLRRTVLPGRPEGSPEVACTGRWTCFRWACSVRASRQVASTCAPAAAVTPESSPEGTRSQRWLARLSFLPAGVGDGDPGGFRRAEERGDACRGPGRRGGEPGRRVLVPFPARHPALVVARGLRPCADCRDRRLRLQGPAVGGGRVGRGLAAREHNRTRGAGQGSHRTGGCPSIRRSRLPGTRT